MLIRRDAVFDFLRDSSGRILIVFGLSSFVLGLLYVSPMGSVTSALGMFLGVFFIDVGFFIHFELYKVKLRSKEGLGNILIGIAPLLIVSGVIYALFAEPDWSHAFILPWHKMGFVKGEGWATVIAPLVRVYLWLAVPLTIVGVCFLVVGFLLKIYDSIF